MNNAQMSQPSPPFLDPYWADRYAAAENDDQRLTVALSYLRTAMKQSTKPVPEKNRIRRELTTAVIHAVKDTWRTQ
jgi:hypothetical protein